MPVLEYERTLFEETIKPSQRTLLGLCYGPAILAVIVIIEFGTGGVIRFAYIMMIPISIGTLFSAIVFLADVQKLTIRVDRIEVSGPLRRPVRLRVQDIAWYRAGTMRPSFFTFVGRDFDGVEVGLTSQRTVKLRSHRGAEITAVLETVLRTPAMAPPVAVSVPPAEATYLGGTTDQSKSEAGASLFQERLFDPRWKRLAMVGLGALPLLVVLLALEKVNSFPLQIRAFLFVGPLIPLAASWWLFFRPIETTVRIGAIDVTDMVISCRIDPIMVRSIEVLSSVRLLGRISFRRPVMIDQEQFEIGSFPVIRLTRADGIPVRISTARPDELVKALRAVCPHLASAE